jgi:hypothetical protein
VLLAQRFQVKLRPGVGSRNFEARWYERGFHGPNLALAQQRTHPDQENDGAHGN